MSIIIGVLLILVGIILPIVMISSANKKPRRQKPSRNNPQKHDNFRTNDRYEELVMLLNGDRKTADRLIKAYGVDKAITDLIRDRR